MSNIQTVIDSLHRRFPSIQPELEFTNDFQFLIAVVLSAQCTDRRVNIVTKEMFKKYKTPYDFMNIPLYELEQMIYSTGFYHNKAKNILALSRIIVEEYNGQMPKTADELVKLPGVGRKVANVVTSFLYGEERIGVDTHIFRVANRLGLVNAKSPLETEKQWCKKYPRYVNHDTHFRLVLFGRYCCKAQKPMCAECEFTGFCKYYKKINRDKG